MKIVKLDSSHILDVRRLFEKKKYMGAMIHSNYFVDTDQDYVEYYHTAFSDTYLSDLNSYHSYVAIDDGGIFQGLI